MAFNWAAVIVPPTGSSGLDTGDHTAVDEAPPWNDSDEAVETILASATEVATFTGFDLSAAPGLDEGYRIWARMRTTGTFTVTVTVKQGGVTVWTSAGFSVTNTAYRTFCLDIPDGTITADNDLSVEFSCLNTAGNATIRWSWLRFSKSPFAAAQKAVLPSTLSGHDFVCYRAADLAVLGAVNGETLILLPDASGGGRHALLRVGTATFDAAIPAFTAASGRFVGALGFLPASSSAELWSGNKVFHGKASTSSTVNDQAIFSIANAADFLGVTIPGHKHIMATQSGQWVLMSGDGTAEAHKAGGTIVANVTVRLTEWVQIGGGNEHMWEDDDAAPIVDASSGDNPFGYWSLFDRESDDRPLTGKVEEIWFVEAAGVTETQIDTARQEWVAGIGNPMPGGAGNRMGGTGAIRHSPRSR